MDNIHYNLTAHLDIGKSSPLSPAYCRHSMCRARVAAGSDRLIFAARRETVKASIYPEGRQQFPVAPRTARETLVTAHGPHQIREAWLCRKKAWENGQPLAAVAWCLPAVRPLPPLRFSEVIYRSCPLISLRGAAY